METAYAPTTRYLTRCAFKVDKSSLKSECIRSHTLHPIALFRQFRNGGHALMHGSALPVPVFVGFHFVEAGVLTDGLVHSFCRGMAKAAVNVSGPRSPSFRLTHRCLH